MGTQADVILFDPRAASVKDKAADTARFDAVRTLEEALATEEARATMPKSRVPKPQGMDTTDRVGQGGRSGQAGRMGRAPRGNSRTTSQRESVLGENAWGASTQMSATQSSTTKGGSTRRVASKRIEVSEQQKQGRFHIEMEEKQIKIAGKELTLKHPKLPDFSNVSLPSMRPEALRRLGVVAIVLVVVVGFLYSPARALYAAKRDEQVLSARLEQINTQNEQLTEALRSLQTREGIEDEARRRGFVNPDETAVTVEGLEGAEGSQSNAGSGVITQELAAAEETEDAFYVQILDFIFQYNPGS